MHKALSIAAMIAALFFSGCADESMLEPESAPGYKYKFGDRAATIREADHCFVRSVDGLEVERPGGISVMGSVTYHQYRLVPGVHTVTVEFYQQQGARGYVRGGPVSVRVKIEPKQLYTINSNRTGGFHIGPFTTDRWHPEFVDDATQKPAVTVSSAQ